MNKCVFPLILATVLFAAGCGNKEDVSPQLHPIPIETTAEAQTTQSDSSDFDTKSSLKDYLAFVKEQSDSINASLENDPLTQADMNEKSQALYTLWDDALNNLWGELKSNLPEKEFEKLLNEQRTWITQKENAVKEAGKEFEGGSLYPLIVNGEAARITEERVYELYELLLTL